MEILSKVADVTPGVVLSKPIYDSAGRVLLKKGSKLNKRYINKLKKLGIKHIYIKNITDTKTINQKFEEKERRELIPEEVKKEAVVIARNCVKKTNIAESTILGKKQVIKLIENIVKQISNKDEIFQSLKDMRLLEDEIFFHLVNVTTLSLVIGNKLGYDQERLNNLGIGAFLHDIGKLGVYANILNKSGNLTDDEFEEVKRHTNYGYKILDKQDDIPQISAQIAYQHHERCDGSGYPKGLTKRFIYEEARIVAIVDVFDAMINDRVYRNGIKVKEVIEYLYTRITLNKLDKELVTLFLDIITPYPLGTKVKLNIGCEAVVVKVNKNAKLCPKVKVLNLNGIDREFEIDLSKKTNINIIDIIQ
ncbi:HD-GYP domain-containing protein [Selenihalanaerobacter shriftii]|uniref:HD-GYP domain, c-di-GMP phosphodiesterase class II (Or its inactivated variant) n=1 Tax=Selenihalanaerobacter shriftii TaxID=142842 RepID=A0A1T4PTR6_9FIRM|nr:HD-GYP domain-containing protein [Selenihalanaerobacter shriftii]SJZ94932.1 HD-GYP domain, c-di-GMP phosphodiesterase class II (or its inactivated variant) [Selenihalanaerobacter shriftii]